MIVKKVGEGAHGSVFMGCLNKACVYKYAAKKSDIENLSVEYKLSTLAHTIAPGGVVRPIAFVDGVIYSDYVPTSGSINKKNFKTKISIIEDGKNILDTGGGIKNMLNHTKEDDVLIFNPDTIWKKNYSKEIIEMEKLYFSKQLKNILLLVNKELSFDKNLNGDFDLQDNLIIKNNNRKFIYTGCQILNKKLVSVYETEKFSINNLWNNLIEKKELYGFETNNDFYHLTDLKTFKKLQDL